MKHQNIFKKGITPTEFCSQILKSEPVEQISVEEFTPIYKNFTSMLLLEKITKRLIEIEQQKLVLFILNEGKLEKEKVFSLFLNQVLKNLSHYPKEPEIKNAFKKFKTFVNKANYNLAEDKTISDFCLKSINEGRKIPLLFIDYFINSGVEFNLKELKKNKAPEIQKWISLYENKVLQSNQTAMKKAQQIKIL